MTNPRHISESAERYTPGYIVEPGRDALGYFDLDPASCHKANSIVMADKFYTAEDDGLRYKWRGQLFLNPPGTCKELAGFDANHKPIHEFPGCGTFLDTIDKKTGEPKRRTTCSCKYVLRFWQKLIDHVDEGDVTAAIWIGFNCSQLQTLQQTACSPLAFLTCFIDHRVKYLGHDLEPMTSPPHNSYITLVVPPRHPAEAYFIEAYAPLGAITRRAA